MRLDCLADALDGRVETGVWGGMTERERRALLRRNPHVRSWGPILAAASGPQATCQNRRPNEADLQTMLGIIAGLAGKIGVILFPRTNAIGKLAPAGSRAAVVPRILLIHAEREGHITVIRAAGIIYAIALNTVVTAQLLRFLKGQATLYAVTADKFAHRKVLREYLAALKPRPPKARSTRRQTAGRASKVSAHRRTRQAA